MRKYRSVFYCFAISFIFITFTISSPSFASTKAQLFSPSKAGRVSTVVANTILSGLTPPRNSDGNVGDFYIDTKAMLFYGPKAKGRWPTPVSMKGPQGQTGQTGSAGIATKSISNVQTAGAQGLSGAQGVKGEQGVQGNQGSTGPAGAKGEAGSIGVAGASGAAGANGSDGSSGAAGPQGPGGGQGAGGANGATGSVGANGVAGATGATGAVGATGSTGLPGVAGPSNVYVISIPAWNLSTATAGTSTDSVQFGTLAANKSYRYSIIVHGVTNVTYGYFGIEMKAGPLAIATLFESGIIENIAYVGSSFVHRYTFIIDGTIAVGSSDSWLKINIIDGAGSTSGAGKMTLSGQAIVQLVGQVTQTG